MRALYLNNLLSQDTYRITGDPLHHLVNVIRIETHEEIVLLSGQGFQVKTKVASVSKREVILTRLDEEVLARPYEIDLALGIPKRDALELCLKQATEIGARRIYLVRGDYSQIKLPEVERVQKLLISALEQSNAAFIPELIESSWSEIPWEGYAGVHLMDSQTGKKAEDTKFTSGAQLLVVGPEGGFSPSELSFLHARPQVQILSLPTPIMRTPTALAVGVGIILQRLMRL